MFARATPVFNADQIDRLAEPRLQKSIARLLTALQAELSSVETEIDDAVRARSPGATRRTPLLGAGHLRQALDEVALQGHTPEDSQVSRLMKWGEARLRDMEEQLRPEQVEERLVEAKLFPAEGHNELHDPLGEPPTTGWL